MWLVRIVCVVVLFVGMLAFAWFNIDHRTSITVISRTYDNVLVNTVLFCAALFGAAVTFLFRVWREIGLRAAIRRLRRENMRLDDELTALRNLPLAGLEPAKKPPARPAAER